VDDILVQDGAACGIRTGVGEEITARAVIVCTGTFLGGRLHFGMTTIEGGRGGDKPANNLSLTYAKMGIETGRMKTGTVPRIHKRSIDTSRMEEQKGDTEPRPFSYSTPIEGFSPNRISCWLCYTGEATHEVIRRNLDKSPLYSGKIEGIGPRYCPSIEDKVMRFPEKTEHRIFLEPEGLMTNEVYVNGLSTSLPEEVQREFLHSVPGLEEAEIIRPGYAVEYDFVPPTQLKPTLETKKIRGLFHAGQINGTSGYEEAAAQGLYAAMNVSRFLRNEAPLFIGRDEGYIGVLVDDIVTRGLIEPYRLFTSRAEYRLHLRQDNADVRLAHYGFGNDEVLNQMRAREGRVAEEMQRLEKSQVDPSVETNQILVACGGAPIERSIPAVQLLRRPDMTLEALYKVCPPPVPLDFEAREQVEIRAKYQGYMDRQQRDIDRFKKAEHCVIPETLDYEAIPGIPRECKDRLKAIRPVNFGQASRISGVRAADIAVLHIYVEKHKRIKN